jgi:hypothetical protein
MVVVVVVVEEKEEVKHLLEQYKELHLVILVQIARMLHCKEDFWKQSKLREILLDLLLQK